MSLNQLIFTKHECTLIKHGCASQKTLFHEEKETQFRPQNTPEFQTNRTEHVMTSWGTKSLDQFQENMQESRIPKFLGF